MKASPVRILIVDDFVPWHSVIQRHLEPHRELRIVASAANGCEAVQKAEEFRPDLILLDVNLPQANGIEVARQIVQRTPRSKILFLSEMCDPDIVEASLAAGGSGYVSKNRIARDLSLGISTVLRGEVFITPELERSDGSEINRTQFAEVAVSSYVIRGTA